MSLVLIVMGATFMSSAFVMRDAAGMFWLGYFMLMAGCVSAYIS